MTDAKNFELYFVVTLLKADNREFRQDSDNLIPEEDLHVCVLLPRENEYVYNLSEISLKELSGEVAPYPILTPKGFAFVKKALETGFDSPNLKETLPESEDWGSTVDTEKSLNPEKVAPDDWGNTEIKLPVGVLDPGDFDPNPFNEDKVESETWEDEKEQW